MGVSGLPTILQKAGKRANLADFTKKRIAVDGASWLYRGAYAAAVDIMAGRHTDVHVRYVVNLARSCRAANVHLVVVFDGRSLPAKSTEHEKRRRVRARAEMEYGQQGEELREALNSIHARRLESGPEPEPDDPFDAQFSDGEDDAELRTPGASSSALDQQLNQARLAQEQAARRAVTISSEMVLETMDALRQLDGVDVMRAPYEADAQLVHLARHTDVAAVLTEDSDLVAHGVDKVLLRLDRVTNDVLLVERKALFSFSTRGFSMRGFTDDMLLEMCVLAGVDYLESPRGLSIVKANQFIGAHKTGPRVIKFIKNFRNRQIKVPPGYEKAYQRALASFRHQRVWSVAERKVVPLLLPPDELLEHEPNLDACIGPHIDDDAALHFVSGGTNVAPDLSPLPRQPIFYDDPFQASARAAVSGATLSRDRARRPAPPSSLHGRVEPIGVAVARPRPATKERVVDVETDVMLGQTLAAFSQPPVPRAAVASAPPPPMFESEEPPPFSEPDLVALSPNPTREADAHVSDDECCIVSPPGMPASRGPPAHADDEAAPDGTGSCWLNPFANAMRGAQLPDEAAKVCRPEPSALLEPTSAWPTAAEVSAVRKAVATTAPPQQQPRTGSFFVAAQAAPLFQPRTIKQAVSSTKGGRTPHTGDKQHKKSRTASAPRKGAKAQRIDAGQSQLPGKAFPFIL